MSQSRVRSRAGTRFFLSLSVQEPQESLAESETLAFQGGETVVQKWLVVS
jgi:hypothetical protein